MEQGKLIKQKFGNKFMILINLNKIKLMSKNCIII